MICCRKSRLKRLRCGFGEMSAGESSFSPRIWVSLQVQIRSIRMSGQIGVFSIAHDLKRDYRSEWRRAISLSDMLRKILFLEKHRAFDRLWPHVLLLLGNSEIPQNVWSPKEDQDANKVFELYAALLALPFCNSIHMDDPDTSS